MKINLAILNQKCNNFDQVDEFLKTSFDVNSLPIEQRLNLAILFNEIGQFQKAIELLYELRRSNFNNEKVHLMYINLMLYENKHREWLHPEKVCLNSVVKIEEKNGREQNYIIENREDKDLKREELNINSNFYKIIAGKCVGEKISLGHFIPEEVTITEIKSKYVYAFQESFEQFNYLFPNTPALSKICTVEKDQKEFSPEIFDSVP
jgi:tetratricopeptide (TPR) repeat protein